MELERFFLVTLRRPADHPALTDAEVAELQPKHLAFYNQLRTDGLVALNGPLRDAPDPAVRGIALFRTATAAEALAHAERDPMVAAGWLAVDAAEFWTQPGAVSAGGTAITV